MGENAENAAEVEPFLTDGVLPDANHKEVLKALHTDTVSAAVSNLGPNRVLTARPPRVSKSEKDLVRHPRVTLSRLRSGFCKELKSYKFFVGTTDDDQCPNCSTASHSVTHLFECPSFPTRLTAFGVTRRP